MPAKNKIKNYIPGAVYHIYNRGVDGRDVFEDQQDFEKFEELMKRYLSPIKEEIRSGFKTDRPYIIRHKNEMNLCNEVELLAYCLMPNHIHLVIRQKSDSGITKLVRRVATNYGMYFNQKHHRRGTLWESVYRAVVIEDEEKLVHLTRWVHLNPVALTVKRFGPVETVTGSRPEEYLYSSYRWYVLKQSNGWVNALPVGEIWNKMFSGKWDSYKKFVEDQKVDSGGVLGQLILE
jgi:putative transposase